MKRIIKKVHRRHAIELFTYAFVGGSAWIVQTAVYFASIKVHIFPSVSMILGNFAGMVIAYFGHVRFTFKQSHRFSHKEFIKYVVTSAFGLCFNVGCVRIMTKLFEFEPSYAIIPTIFTPLLTFLISKFWAFKS